VTIAVSNGSVATTTLPKTSTSATTALSDEALLRPLMASSAAVHDTRSVLQHVELLRQRGVSRGRIGEALGASRQAAWERFS
jgi:hypothetical protein